MILRDYQNRAIEQVRAAFKETRRVLLVMPTGAGKTATASQILAWAVTRNRRCLFIVHRREIVQDTHRRLLAGGVPCGLVMAGSPITDAPVQVCSVQTLAARGLHPPADFLVWDEAHHVAAATYMAIREKYVNAWHLGLTATPERADGRPLGDAFDQLVAPITVRELVEAGHLAPIDVIAPDVRLSKALAKTPADAIQDHAPGRPAVIFAQTIAESMRVRDDLLVLGRSAWHVDGDTAYDERAAGIAAFESGLTDALCNVAVLTEGWDSARAEVCVLARGCGSLPVYLQAIGRVRRNTGRPDKRCLLLDLPGASIEWGMPDDDRHWSLTQSQAEIRKAKKKQEANGNGVDPLEITGDELRKREAADQISQERLIEYYRAQLKIAGSNGYKPGFAALRYKRKFGMYPPWAWRTLHMDAYYLGGS